MERKEIAMNRIKIFAVTLAVFALMSPGAHAADKKTDPKIKQSKENTLKEFKSLKAGSPVSELFDRFGQPEKDIGSGIHIYQYRLPDDSLIQVGCVENIFYVDHVVGINRERLSGKTAEQAENEEKDRAKKQAAKKE
jgi:hypothetical protein